jgi:hypothetical protein
MVNRHSDEVVDYLVHECYIWIILWTQLPPPVIAVPDLDAFKVAVKGIF